MTYLLDYETKPGDQFLFDEIGNFWEYTGKTFVPEGCCNRVYEMKNTESGQIWEAPAESWIYGIKINES